MRFAISAPLPVVIEAQLVYSEQDCAFDFEPRPDDCAYAVSVNEVELMIDEELSRIVFVAGYCPYFGWRSVELVPPHSHRGVLEFEDAGGHLIPGVTKKINSLESRWAVFVDPANGWVCMGSPGEHDSAVEFAPGCVAVLQREQLVALWLHPADLPRGVKIHVYG